MSGCPLCGGGADALDEDDVIYLVSEDHVREVAAALARGDFANAAAAFPLIFRDLPIAGEWIEQARHSRLARD